MEKEASKEEWDRALNKARREFTEELKEPNSEVAKRAAKKFDLAENSEKRRETIDKTPNKNEGPEDKVINIDFEKGKKAEEETEKAAAPEQEKEKPASFFEKGPDEVEERLTEKRKEQELKDELRSALKKLHRAVDNRRRRNKKLEGEPLARAQRALAEQLMAKGQVKEILVKWFQKELGNEPKTIMFELIKDSWANDEEVTAYYVRIGQEKNMWLGRRLKEIMKEGEEIPSVANS